MRRMFSRFVTALALLSGALAWSSTGLSLATPALAGEPAKAASGTVKITLKDGRVLEGEIVREIDGNVWLKHSIKGVVTTDFFTASDIKSIDRGGAPAADAAKADPIKETPAAVETPRRPGVPRGIVLSCGDRESGDMVGVFITVHAFEQVMPMLERDLGKDGSGILVLRISSGGGYQFEMLKLAKYIHTQLKSKFRTVLWVDSAISAAAMMGHSCEEIYFTPQGNFGACTSWHGDLVASKDMDLEKILYEMEKISELGHHDIRIMRSMQIQEPLSASVDENGQITFFQDATSGQFVVNRPGEILTLNADTAAKIKFSKGTASTLEELTKLMGYQEVDWVGKQVAGKPYPISKAEEWMLKYRKQVKEDEEQARAYQINYQQAVQAAQGAQGREARAPFVGRARVALGKIKEMVRNNPNMAISVFNAPPEEFWKWIEEQERLLRDLMR